MAQIVHDICDLCEKIVSKRNLREKSNNDLIKVEVHSTKGIASLGICTTCFDKSNLGEATKKVYPLFSAR